MRRILSLLLTVCLLLLTAGTALSENDSFPVNKNVTADTPSDLLESLKNEQAANRQKVQNQTLTAQTRLADGYDHIRSGGDMKLRVVVNKTRVTVGEKVQVIAYFQTSHAPVVFIKSEEIYNTSAVSQGITAVQAASANRTSGNFNWTYTTTTPGFVTFSVAIQDDSGTIIAYTTPTVQVLAKNSDLPYVGLAQNGSNNLYLEVNKDELGVDEQITANVTIQSASPTAAYVCEWRLFDDQDVVIDSKEYVNVITPDASKVYQFKYNPPLPGTLVFILQCTDENNDLIDINSHLVTVRPVITASVDKTTVTSSETVKVNYKIDWPGKSASVKGRWVFTDAAGNVTEKTVSLNNSSGTATYATQKAGTLQLVITATASGKTHTLTTEKVTVNARVPGDADGNGSVTVADARLVLQHVAGKTAAINLINANVNGDSKVNTADALLIMKHAAGWDVTLK